MKYKRRHYLERGRFDITPLVDVVFLLLIFFMLSSSFVMQPGIKVDLPHISTVALHHEENMVVTLKPDGDILFNDEITTLDGFRRRIRSAARKNPDGVLIIKADAQIAHGQVVKIMNIAYEAGVNEIAIAAEPGDQATMLQ